jgi:ferredoxin--NADP+ reductase
MMKFVSWATQPFNVPTIVSLNSIMIDGTGMCGGCRVITSGKAKFACVDGPEFDAHEVDFKVLAMRNNAYRDAEQASLRAFEAHADEEVARVRAQCRLAEVAPSVAALDGAVRAEAAR